MQAISEDASRRGVLRSTLPVDAQQDLQGQIGAALAQSQGQLGLQQGEAVSGLQSQIGQLGIDRVGAVNSLANTLNKQDLSRQQFSYQKQRDAQEAELARQRFEYEKQLAQQQLAAARSRASSGGGGGNYGQPGAKGYSLSQKPDGAGYMFKGPNNRPISMAAYASATGTPMVELLKNSASAYDKRAYNAAIALQRGGVWNETQIESYIKEKFPALF